MQRERKRMQGKEIRMRGTYDSKKMQRKGARAMGGSENVYKRDSWVERM